MRDTDLQVNTSVTLAMHLLILQLAHLRERHPQLQVQIRTVEGDIDPALPADVFLRRDAAELRGLPAQIFMRERSVLVDNTVLAIQAAVQGLGALVVPASFVSTMLTIGALQRRATAIDTGCYSFAVGRRQASARVAMFTDWLLERGWAVSG